MQLTGEEVEAAFTETAREQQNGEPFNWNRVALHLNERLADNLVGRSRFIFRPPAVGEDGAADQNAATKTPLR